MSEAVKACRNDDDFAEAMGFDGRVKIREGWTKEQLIESLAEMDTDGDCSIPGTSSGRRCSGPGTTTSPTTSCRRRRPMRTSYARELSARHLRAGRHVGRRCHFRERSRFCSARRRGVRRGARRRRGHGRRGSPRDRRAGRGRRPARLLGASSGARCSARRRGGRSNTSIYVYAACCLSESTFRRTRADAPCWCSPDVVFFAP